MDTDKIFTFDDFSSVAHKNLPKLVYDFIAGGSGNELALQRNCSVFNEVQLIPKIRNGEKKACFDTSVLDINYSVPFGIAPIGLAGLVNPHAEKIFAKIAFKYNAPYIFSSVSNTPLDQISDTLGNAPWFQLYIPKVDSLLCDLLELAEKNRCPVLVLTVDTAMPGRRIRDLKNGLKLPLDFKSLDFLDIFKHPLWIARQLSSGPIKFPNMASLLKSRPELSFSEIMSLQTGGELNWDTIRYIRSHWKNKIILKGVLSVDDAIRASSIGIDGVIISNHGGRQLNYAPPPFDLIGQFSQANSGAVMMDSGIRNGEDIVACFASGAQFVFLGRFFLFALAAKGEKGLDRAFQLLIEELNIAITLMGVEKLNQLTPQHILSTSPFLRQT
jgi:isopentenyl diphosphate isomerase/L-lactate dehydrogenase-like FMN-dependent dehydrogenase